MALQPRLADSLAVSNAYEVQVVVPLVLNVGGGKLASAQCLLQATGQGLRSDTNSREGRQSPMEFVKREYGYLYWLSRSLTQAE